MTAPNDLQVAILEYGTALSQKVIADSKLALAENKIKTISQEPPPSTVYIVTLDKSGSCHMNVRTITLDYNEACNYLRAIERGDHKYTSVYTLPLDIYLAPHDLDAARQTAEEWMDDHNDCGG